MEDSLSYVDYGSNKTTSIRSNLRTKAAGTDSRAWAAEYIYPDELKANRQSEYN